ncbi:MAG: hypothetical protein QOJ80_1112 [Mycobacterium sp.]|nr:hypothetical protein [Mycobacterium sp.]
MAAMYDAGVKHDSVARVGAWAMWGADLRRMFADVSRLADAPPGTSILDIPCGGGSALRGLRPGQVQDAIEFVESDVTALQFADNSFDLCVPRRRSGKPRSETALMD